MTTTARPRRNPQAPPKKKADKYALAARELAAIGKRWTPADEAASKALQKR